MHHFTSLPPPFFILWQIKVFEFVVNLLTRQNTTQKVTGVGFKAGQKNKEKAELSYIRSQLREELGIKVGVKTGEIGKWKRVHMAA